jgi:hypothetical protein
MRMWMVSPELLCRQHLLGEHKEIHMLAGALLKGRSLAGHVERGQLDPAKLESRHLAIVKEMRKRGYKHTSPLPYVPKHGRPKGEVNAGKAYADLLRRCAECRARQSVPLKKAVTYVKAARRALEKAQDVLGHTVADAAAFGMSDQWTQIGGHAAWLEQLAVALEEHDG